MTISTLSGAGARLASGAEEGGRGGAACPSGSAGAGGGGGCACEQAAAVKVAAARTRTDFMFPLSRAQQGVRPPARGLASACLRGLWYARELVEDRRDRLPKVLLVLRLVVGDVGHSLSAPEELLGLGIDHVDDHCALGVLRDRRLHIRPEAPPARVVGIPIIPVGDVQLVLRRRVVRDGEVRSVREGIAAVFESLEIGRAHV